jgi:hypothetical protein
MDAIQEMMAAIDPVITREYSGHLADLLSGNDIASRCPYRRAHVNTFELRH